MRISRALVMMKRYSVCIEFGLEMMCWFASAKADDKSY